MQGQQERGRPLHERVARGGGDPLRDPDAHPPPNAQTCDPDHASHIHTVVDEGGNDDGGGGGVLQ